MLRAPYWVTLLITAACLVWALPASAQTGGPVTISLSCDKTELKPGETVGFTAVVTSSAGGGTSSELLFCTASYQDPSTGRDLATASNPIELIRSGWVLTELPLRILLGPMLTPVPGSFTLDGVSVPAEISASGEAVVILPVLSGGQSRTVRWTCTVK